MRQRVLREMIRDSRAGSIVIAKSIAMCIVGIIEVLSWTVERILAPVLNYVAVHGFRSDMGPFVEFEGTWTYPLFTDTVVLLSAAFWLGSAYLFAAWLYKPSPRRS